MSTFCVRSNVVFLLSIGIFIRCAGQSGEEYYTWFDTETGMENSGLYQGVVYREQFRTINEHTKFLASPEFLSGRVVYGGQPYYGLQLKYDVYGDRLLLKLDESTGGGTIELFTEKISSFVIDGRTFVRLSEPSPGIGISGFYERSVQNEQITLYTKHLKKAFSRKDRSSLYYEFLDLRKQYLLHYEGDYYRISAKKDLIDVFPARKEEINTFYNRGRTRRRTDPHGFMIAMVTRIGNLLNSQPIDSVE